VKSERGFLKTARVVLIAVASWFVLNIIGELIGNQANETAWGRVLGHYVLLAAVFATPIVAVVLVVIYLRDRRDGPHVGSSDEPDDPDEEDAAAEWPAPPAPPVWHRPGPLYGRDSEVDRAVAKVLGGGAVVVAGPRDIGTSAVAEAVVQRLIDSELAAPDRTTRFDLRSRSSARPDDARAAAGRVVSAFGVDEPADGTPALLADAGHRLLEALREDYDVLMLDNASTPEEVEWLVRSWPGNGRPWLVVAGESAIAPVSPEATVLIDELGPAGLQAMWRAEVPSTVGRRIWGRRSRRHGVAAAEDLDALLEACFGRPGVLAAFIREIVRPGSSVSVKSMVAAAASPGSPDGVLERVWTEMLNHVREGLPDNGVWLLHALAELPVTALSRDAIEALHSEAESLEELRIRNLVREADGRYRLPLEVRRAVVATTAEEVRRGYARQAIPALLRHYRADASKWAARFGYGAKVGDWFHDAERSLRPLFNVESYVDEQLLELVLDDLAVIADALEGWYVREQQAGGLLAVNTALHTLAERAGRPELAGAAAIRMATAHRMVGRIGDAGTKLDVAARCAAGLRHDQASELAVREHVERALLYMAGVRPELEDPAGAADPDGADGPAEGEDAAGAEAERKELADAEAELDRILATHRDHQGATAALINLGALCVKQRRPDAALRHLRRAERLAIDRRDLGCRAHALELQGVALSSQDGRLLDAVAAWRLAEHYFATIGEEQGESRCLQHLGAAALVDGKAAGQIRDNRPHPLDDSDAAVLALGLLRRAKRLRAGQPGTHLLDHYLAIAQDRVERRDPPLRRRTGPQPADA
jgi:tetratricopeptide (TPR) repeat protein